MASYSISDAIRDLGPVLDKAPPGAVSGEWIATTMQAGVSSREGSYMNAEGAPVGLASANSADPFNIIGEVVEKLDASQSQRFNKVIVRWRKAKIPFMRGRVTLETIFDEAIVPRGPDDPIYETAAAVRLAFWKSRGDIPDGFAAERDAPNIHNQTKWFGPHRRVLAVRTPERLTLATDGLSTPWAGVSEPENGVECELFMEFDVATIDDRQIDDWAHLLITIGDLVADGHRVAREVEKHGAVLFCRLTDDYSSMSRIILSRDTSRIEGLPFGSVPLIRATPIAETEIEDQDLSDDWAAKAANNVLARRRLATNGKQPALNCRILPGLPPLRRLCHQFPEAEQLSRGLRCRIHAVSRSKVGR